MNDRCLLWGGAAAAVLAAAVVSASPALAQSTNNKAAGAAGGKASYQTPRTPWGHADLQGVWNFSTPTPLERPAALADVEFLTKEQVEAAAITAASRDRRPSDKVADVR